ncbi:triose-phosphate isomerase [Rubrivirga sp. S365]|uniref:Triosephosphate isomerase n=1 Tax=Rubrivirga litoralis TaxID=3075598 RepID=A0ABU3BQL7_9BACT|nr:MULTISPECIES: triose-phosphate isomerase [unclassified Rubrivirga]MDT0631582.1 triose-phosphate isomerase [Rubrivirga sp. F394]MDT7857227.1 triose-phosphate isomerase [Rubrivirga sp. S365]
MLVVGNWKMNTDLDGAVRLASDVVRETGGAASGVGVCPPTVWLDAVAERVRGSRVRLGAQNVHPAPEGAFTGETAPPMLAALGVDLVVVGHSERRQLFGETSAFVAEKVRAAMGAGLVPILCVGETLEERDAGDAEATVLAQLDASLDGVELASADRLVVAYEPVWAIGTGRTASPEQAQAVHAAVRARLAERFDGAGRGVALLYGGSVKPGNAADLFAQPDLDGALVGGASLDASDFAQIVAAADDAGARRAG